MTNSNYGHLRRFRFIAIFAIAIPLLIYGVYFNSLSVIKYSDPETESSTETINITESQAIEDSMYDGLELLASGDLKRTWTEQEVPSKPLAPGETAPIKKPSGKSRKACPT